MFVLTTQDSAHELTAKRDALLRVFPIYFSSDIDLLCQNSKVGFTVIWL